MELELITHHQNIDILVAIELSQTEGENILEHNFGFCKTFARKIRIFRFSFDFPNCRSTTFFYTKLANDNTVTINSSHRFISTYITDSKAQLAFKDSFKNTITLSFASWTTDRKIDKTGSDYQVVIGSTAKNNSSNFLVVVHQKEARARTANKAKNSATFEMIDVR